VRDAFSESIDATISARVAQQVFFIHICFHDINVNVNITISGICFFRRNHRLQDDGTSVTTRRLIENATKKFVFVVKIARAHNVA